MKKAAQIVSIALIVISQQLTGCTSRSDKAASVLVRGDGFMGVIFPVEKKLYGFGFAPASQSWMPSEDDVRLAEKQLPSFLKESAVQSPEGLVIAKHLSSYKRQYAGILTGGQKLIFFNLFCNAFDTDWTQQPVVVEDGGSCFFQVQFSMKTRSFSNLQINGRG
jgi:hypothetical protein